MDWIIDLLTGSSVARSILLLSFVIALGILLGKIKIFGISLGVTLVLFVGILVSHFGFVLDGTILHFVKELGLIFFVFSIGLQVGPGFFSSFKQGGLTLNLLATTAVALSVMITIVIHFVTNIPMSTMVGVLSGAVTNTPGLGAAQQTYQDILGQNDPSIALGYAVAYPLGVCGIILSIISIRYLFRIKIAQETANLETSENHEDSTLALSLIVENPSLFGKSIKEIKQLIGKDFVISRILRADGTVEIGSPNVLLHQSDKILLVTVQHERESIIAFIGKEDVFIATNWDKVDHKMYNSRIIVSHTNVLGKTISELGLRRNHDVNITRINRAGVDLIGRSDFKLQFGDKLTAVGNQAGIEAVSEQLGNEIKKLDEPNLFTLFIGIVIGIILGSIPIYFPGMPQAVKLGLAGGPLIVAILISVFGCKFKLISYTTDSANLMLKEIGICLFLACVGLGAGESFVKTLLYEGGLYWVAYGVIITCCPLIIIGAVGRYFLKINYFTLMGLMAGSTTDPPALAFATTSAGNNSPAVSYATVYPLTMFLRVLAAQILILLFC